MDMCFFVTNCDAHNPAFQILIMVQCACRLWLTHYATPWPPPLPPLPPPFLFHLSHHLCLDGRIPASYPCPGLPRGRLRRPNLSHQYPCWLTIFSIFVIIYYFFVFFFVDHVAVPVPVQRGSLDFRPEWLLFRPLLLFRGLLLFRFLRFSFLRDFLRFVGVHAAVAW